MRNGEKDKNNKERLRETERHRDIPMSDVDKETKKKQKERHRERHTAERHRERERESKRHTWRGRKEEFAQKWLIEKLILLTWFSVRIWQKQKKN